MTHKNIKTAYQYSKTVNKEHTAERLLLGEREIQTFKLLARDVGVELGANKRLLDLGSADRFLEPACLGEHWDYQGLDYVDVDFEVDPFPVQDSSVDFAVSLAVIEHLRDPGLFLSEIYRCLKPGGGWFTCLHLIFSLIGKIFIMIRTMCDPTRPHHSSSFSCCQDFLPPQRSQVCVEKKLLGIKAVIALLRLITSCPFEVIRIGRYQSF
jgi:SAM-dependent methyltransferase